jgi:hypothetical protein
VSTADFQSTKGLPSGAAVLSVHYSRPAKSLVALVEIATEGRAPLKRVFVRPASGGPYKPLAAEADVSHYSISVARDVPIVFVTEFRVRARLGLDWVRLYRFDLASGDEQTILSADSIPGMLAGHDVLRFWILELVDVSHDGTSLCCIRGLERVKSSDSTEAVYELMQFDTTARTVTIVASLGNNPF